MVGKLPEGHLGTGGVQEEPVGRGTNGGSTNIDTNDHVSEEQPGSDEGLVGSPGWFVHDVEVGGVEGESSGGQAVSDEVHPQQLDGDQSLGEAESGGQENTDNLADVGGDQVTDELLHVGVDGAALLHSGHDGGEVVVGQDHLGGGLGHGSSGAHGDTDLGSLQGGGVVDTVSSHGGDLLHLLEILNNLRLVERLHTGKHPGLSTGSLLFSRAQIVELTAREGQAFSALVLSEDSNPLADCLSGVLVVAGDHDHSDSGLLAEDNGGSDLHPRWVQHADDAAEGEVHLVLGELAGVLQVHILGVHGGVGGGQTEASECVSAGSVANSLLHDLISHLLRHGDLLGSNPGIGASVQDALGSSLHKHLGSVSETSGLLWCAEGGHGLPVSAELQGVVLLPLALQVLPDGLGRLEASSRLGDSVGIDLLSQGDQGGLGGLANLLEDVLEVVEVKSRVVAHDRNGGHFLQGNKVGSLHFFAAVEDVPDRLVGGPGDFKLLKVVLVSEGEHLADRHHVGGEGAGLVGADDGGAAESLHGGQRADDGVLGGHPPGAQGEAGGDDGGQTLRDGGNSQSNGDLEVVDSTLDPGATVSGVVEVSNVDGPDSNADESDHLGELLTELVELLLEGSLDLLSLSHLVSDLANGGVGAGTDDDTPGLAGSHIGAGEDDVLLVLVDGPGVGDGLGVLDDRHRLSGQDGLVNTEGGGVDLYQTEVGGNLVSD